MNQLPDYIQNRQSRGLAARVSQNLGTSSPPYLSLMDSKFTLVDAAGNEQPILTFEGDPAKCMRGQAPGAYVDIVIIDVNDHVSQQYYPPDDSFDRNAGSWSPPVCFSHNGIGPSKLSSEPQAPTCSSCPNVVWGSATSKVTGKGVPACHQYQLISFLYAGHDTPFLLRIPPNSLKNYRAYAEQFRGQQFDMDNVITRLSFISQGTLAFIPCNFAPQPMIAQTDKLIAAKATDSMVGRLDVPVQGALPAPTAAPAQPLAGTAPLVAPAAVQEAQPFAPVQTVTGSAPVATAANPAPARRRRNTAAAAPVQAPQQAVQTQAPFMEQPAAAPPAQPQPTFGMAPGVPPNAEVSTMLDNLFGPAK